MIGQGKMELGEIEQQSSFEITFNGFKMIEKVKFVIFIIKVIYLELRLGPQVECSTKRHFGLILVGQLVQFHLQKDKLKIY